MEKNLFREVYKQVCGLALKDCPPSSLSGLLHGYLSVYSMVRVYPWLEDEYGSLWDIHDRIREIARVIQELLKDKDMPVDSRAGYVVDLMDAYLLYSDMKFVDVALDAAYEIFIPKGSNKIVLPCRTPNICRLLCNCYYFTGAPCIRYSPEAEPPENRNTLRSDTAFRSSGPPQQPCKVHQLHRQNQSKVRPDTCSECCAERGVS